VVPASITADKRMARGIDVIANLIFSKSLSYAPDSGGQVMIL
jgi:hypothetical protein